MDINRNQFFMSGMVILLIGLQFRAVDAFVLNEPTSKFIAEKLDQGGGASTGNDPALLSVSAGGKHQTVRPPKWVGWAFISVGAVLILHSLAMPRPD